MNEIFLKIVNMSISASYLVLAVIILRFALKKSPKWVNVLLWGIVAVRLICPFSFESIFSLIPSAETIPLDIEMNTNPTIDSGIGSINNVINPIISQSNTPVPGSSINPLQITVGILENLWILGAAALLIYAVISYVSLRRKVKTAVLYEGNIFQSENVVSPFVLGIIKPKIYLPYGMDIRDMEHVIAHEKTHIQRRDHLWKPLGFLLLAVHWFNPLIWIAYILLCRDIELACDEKIIKDLGSEERANYTEALVACSVNRRIIAACPLAFGEVGVKERVKSVLNYKKPAFWIIIVAVIASIVVAVCFLTNPFKDPLDTKESEFVESQIIEHHRGGYKSGEFYCTDFEILGTEEKDGHTTVFMWVLYQEYNEENGMIESVGGAHVPTAITFREQDGSLSLVEYWEPRDGAYYKDDIKFKFPWYLHSAALNSQRYIEEQTEKCDKIAEDYFAANTNNQSVRSFKPFELVYCDTAYPYTQPVDSAVYTIINSRQLVLISDGVSVNVGTFRQMELNANTFDSRFRRGFSSWVSDEVLEDIKENNKNAWQLYGNESTENPYFYVLFEQFDGTFYLGYGYYKVSGEGQNPDSSHIRWLYKLGEIVGVTDPEGDNNPSAVTNESLTRIPDLTVVSGKENVSALKSTASWTYRQEDGTFVSVMADPVHPLLLKDQMPKLNITPTPISSISPLDAILIFNTSETSPSLEVPPDEIYVRCWDTEHWMDTDSFGENIDVQRSGGYWYFRMKEGSYIYEITATWANYENFGGTAKYAFYTSSNLFQQNDPLITLDRIDKETISETDCHLYVQEDTEYTQYLLVKPSEQITDIKLSFMDYTDEAKPGETLYALDKLDEDKPLVLGVVFYGDLTTYVLSFTDANGNERQFMIYESGKDGSIVLQDKDNLPITYPFSDSVYSEMTEDEANEKLKNEEFVITRTHYKTAEGKWFCEGILYDYRIEISGRMPNAAKNTAYIVLSNTKDITFEKAYLASGVSSATDDYFAPEDAVIVATRLFTPSSSENDLHTAISAVLKEKYCSDKPDGLIHAENYVLLANTEASGTPLKGNSGHMKTATCYLLVYHMKYAVSGDHLEEVEGDFIPTAITFEVNENSQYSFKEYWTPRLGENYEEDVRAKFPGSSADEALNVEKYAEDLTKGSRRMATETWLNIQNNN